MDYLWRKHSKFTMISGSTDLTYFCTMCEASVLMSVVLTAAITYACNYTFFPAVNPCCSPTVMKSLCSNVMSQTDGT